jgi:hypothetical protein
MYWANNEESEDKKLCGNEKTNREQRRLESCYKPIVGLMTNDDDD